MGNAEDKFVLLLSNTLSVAVLELFWNLVAKFTVLVCDRFCVVNMRLVGFFFFGCFQ
jgi:hypothetical protein